MARNTKMFPGELGVRGPSSLPLLRAKTDREREHLWSAHENREQALLDLLCKHYRIVDGEDRYRRLSVALATDFVPAFQQPAEIGRPKKWNKVTGGLLVIEIDNLLASQTDDIVKAATILAGQEPWRSFLSQWDDYERFPDPAEALRKAYFQQRRDKKNVAEHRDVYEQILEENKLWIWDWMKRNFVK